jgi:uncharacterized protein YicC (UPF0701 family)
MTIQQPDQRSSEIAAPIAPTIEPVFTSQAEQKIDFGQYIINKNNIANYYNQMTSLVSNSTKLISSMVKMSRENLVAEAKKRKDEWDQINKEMSIQQANEDRAERIRRRAEADERIRKAEAAAIKQQDIDKRVQQTERELDQVRATKSESLKAERDRLEEELNRLKEERDRNRDILDSVGFMTDIFDLLNLWDGGSE